MKVFCIAACAILFTCNHASLAQSEVSCGQTLDAPLKPGSILKIDSMPAGVQIVGTEQESLRVTCSQDRDGSGEIRLRLSKPSGRAQLLITGPHLKNGNVIIRVEVPRRTNLQFRMAAGDLRVEEITGDKDLELHAGRITVASHDWNYRKVDASVSVGAVNAHVYGSEKGGFFPDFKKEKANGEHLLHVHLGTGEIDLVGKDSDSATDPN